MTGAPKLRTVQLLEEYEGRRRRGIYSGTHSAISSFKGTNERRPRVFLARRGYRSQCSHPDYNSGGVS